MEVMTLLEAVEEISQNVPKRKEMSAKEYNDVKALQSHARSGRLGVNRFTRFAKKFAPGLYRVEVRVIKE